MKNNRHKTQKTERLGSINKNTFGTEMKIIEYYGAYNIIIEFQDEYKYKTKATYQQFINGEVFNPYDKRVFNIGYLGDGKYESCLNGIKNKIYKCWNHIFERCYNPYKLNKQPTYIDCYIDEEWHCFQNFAKWYEENYYECNGEVMQLDKDILVKGNKIYSPETCIFVPERINKLFTKRQNHRGNYPIGVKEHGGRLEVYCNIFKDGKYKQKYLASFPLNKPFQAFTCYKQFKENYIKQVADEYYSKGLIPKKLYDVMYKYEVEIND